MVSTGVYCILQTVVETPPYLRSIEGLFNEEERRAIVDLVSQYPECGDLMPGMGGFRKVSLQGRGWGSEAALALSTLCVDRTCLCS